MEHAMLRIRATTEDGRGRGSRPEEGGSGRRHGAATTTGSSGIASDATATREKRDRNVRNWRGQGPLIPVLLLTCCGSTGVSALALGRWISEENKSLRVSLPCLSHLDYKEFPA